MSIINFDKKGEINPDIYFCKKNTKLYLSLFSFGKEKNFIFENSDDIPFVLDLYGGGNKLTFKTNKPIIFSYFIPFCSKYLLALFMISLIHLLYQNIFF